MLRVILIQCEAYVYVYDRLLPHVVKETDVLLQTAREDGLSLYIYLGVVLASIPAFNPLLIM